jgi:hypothetical protein
MTQRVEFYDWDDGREEKSPLLIVKSDEFNEELLEPEE